MKTHQQALDIAGDYDNLSDQIQAYIKARGMVLVPKEPTGKMVDDAREAHEGEHYLPYSLFSTMLAAAPNPFEVEE